MDQQDGRLVGFDARKWRSLRPIVARQAEALAGEAVWIRLIAAGVGPTGSRELTVITDRDILVYGPSLRTALELGTALPQPQASWPVREILRVHPYGRLWTVKVEDHHRSSLRLTCPSEELARTVQAVAWPVTYRVLPSAGYPFRDGDVVRFWQTRESLVFASPGTGATTEIPFARMVSLGTGGASSAFVWVQGMMAQAAQLAGASPTGHTDLRVETLDGELNLRTTMTSAQGLEEELAGAQLAVRRLDAERAAAERAAAEEAAARDAEKLDILFLSANPVVNDRLALDEEIRSVRQKIRLADGRDKVRLVSHWAVRPDDLLQHLNEHRPHVVHFSGHGSSTGELMFVDDRGQPKPVPPAALGALFHTLRDNVRLVLLNACYSRPQSQAIVQSVDYVVGMKAAIADEAAVIFSSSFYRALAFGRTVEEAFRQAKVALMLEGVGQEDTPELLVRPGASGQERLLSPRGPAA
ncbi:CHAT domain-containing protein [Streptomyces sp. 4N509B]|uniref:CHAT domain-containing protein n=1 Tax=Streptomyces sp. 4N509B TaxID=3457413 RepID=UPI003FD3BE54